MELLGKVLFYAGCIAASYFAVRDVRDAKGKKVDLVDWRLYAPCLAVGVVGIVLMRRAGRQSGIEEHAAYLKTAQDSMARIAQNVCELDASKASMRCEKVPQAIERAFQEDINIFIEARKSIAQAYSLAAYTEIMNGFCSGERYLNRAWCAAVDGYEREALDCLEHARAHFVAVDERLKSLGKVCS